MWHGNNFSRTCCQFFRMRRCIIYIYICNNNNNNDKIGAILDWETSVPRNRLCTYCGDFIFLFFCTVDRVKLFVKKKKNKVDTPANRRRGGGTRGHNLVVLIDRSGTNWLWTETGRFFMIINKMATRRNSNLPDELLLLLLLSMAAINIVRIDC